MADNNSWASSKRCGKCKGEMNCQRWGGDDGGDIRIACLSCGNSFVVNRNNKADRQWYVPEDPSRRKL